MNRPNDYQKYLDIAADKTEKPERAVADAYFTATCPRFDTKTGEAETPFVVTIRRPQLRQHYAELKAAMEEIEATYTAFGLDLKAIIAAEEAAAEGGEE